MTKKDFYQILGVNKSSTQEEIEKSYQELDSKWNPEKFREFSKCEDGSCGIEKDGSKEKYFCSPLCQKTYGERVRKVKEINEAYETLSDPKKRREHDNSNKTYENSNYSKSAKPKSDGFIFFGILVVVAFIVIKYLPL